MQELWSQAVFLWQCVAQCTAEKRSRKCHGGHALVALLWEAAAPGPLEPSRRRTYVRAAGWPGQATLVGVLGEQGGLRCWEAEEEPGDVPEPTFSREGPFPGLQGRLGGNCCHLGNHCKCLNRKQDGGKLAFPLLPTKQPQHLCGSVIATPPAQLCFLKVCCSAFFTLCGFSLKRSFGV